MWIKNPKSIRLIFLISLPLLAVVGFLFFKALIVTSQPSAADFQSKLNPPTLIPTAGFGILGDSGSDEYRADNNRGGEFGQTTFNWMEQLVLKRNLNFGKWGTWGEPRRTGYEYNWARSGATAGSLISSGQHTGLAEQVANGEVSHVVIWIGSNDFNRWNGTYDEIYDGSLSGSALQAKLDGIVADITTAADTILAAGDVPMVIITIGDKGMGPDFQVDFPDPAKRQRVTDAINEVNAGIEAMATTRGIVAVDISAFADSLLSQIDEDGFLNVGGEQISFLEKGYEPHHFQLDDSTGHAGTVASGLVANGLFIEPFNQVYGLGIARLSDQEILENAGLSRQ